MRAASSRRTVKRNVQQQVLRGGHIPTSMPPSSPPLSTPLNRTDCHLDASASPPTCPLSVQQGRSQFQRGVTETLFKRSKQVSSTTLLSSHSTSPEWTCPRFTSNGSQCTTRAANAKPPTAVPRGVGGTTSELCEIPRADVPGRILQMKFQAHWRKLQTDYDRLQQRKERQH